MDPAYLVWIPPLDDGNIINEVENEMEPHYEEILPHHGLEIDPGSNTETPENEIQPELPPPNRQNTSKTNPGNRTLENMQMTKKNLLNDRHEDRMEKITDEIQLQELSSPKYFNRKITSAASIVVSSPVRKVSGRKEATTNVDNDEKETTVVKSPSDNITDYYGLDDIQFADDDDEDDDNDDDINCVREKNHANELSKTGSGGGGGGHLKT